MLGNGHADAGEQWVANGGAPAEAARAQILRYANLELRPAEFQALVDGRRTGLTVREFQVLYALAEHEDHVVPRAEIYRRVWEGEMKHRERAVDVFVRKVRNKLALAAPGWAYIHTHFGIGYRFTPERTPTAVLGRAPAPSRPL
ncbi:MAG TPA: response regulator transcription factor [Solirubrobacteraceae bacterium]|jgi:DNA-binding response OmpR family regulator|nr:response regulator transcription factor [Solirubrobacteraceae bacterium]